MQRNCTGLKIQTDVTNPPIGESVTGTLRTERMEGNTPNSQIASVKVGAKHIDRNDDWQGLDLLLLLLFQSHTKIMQRDYCDAKHMSENSQPDL